MRWQCALALGPVARARVGNGIMNLERSQEPRVPNGLGDVIARANVRQLYHALLETLVSLHDGVALRHSAVDVRAEFRGGTFCRIVPYQELVHVQVGEAPVWEVRVRDDVGYLEAVDRILGVFTRLAASAVTDATTQGQRFPLAAGTRTRRSPLS